MDSFKIVATKEKRQICITAVPHKWEVDSTLLWPDHLTHSERENVRSNAGSTPDGDWTKYPCLVKVSGLKTFEDALLFEKKLTDCVDTEAEENLLHDMLKRKRKRATTNTIPTNVMDRNNLFALYTQDVDEIPSKKVNVISQQTIQPAIASSGVRIAEIETHQMNAVNEQTFCRTIPVHPDGSVDINFLNDGELEIPNLNLAYCVQEITNLKNEISLIKDDILRSRSELQNQLKDDFTKINLNLEKIFRILSTQNQQPKKEQQPKPNLLEDVQFPLATCEDIALLEQKIRNNSDFRSQLVEFCSQIGGRSGVEDGTKLAYKIADTIFKPEVLTHYTWTGVSRTSSGEKKSFQSLDGILGVFFEVLSLADNRHTQKKNCDIFKEGLLKHAKKRTSRKRLKQENHNQDIITQDNIHEDEAPTQFDQRDGSNSNINDTQDHSESEESNMH